MMSSYSKPSQLKIIKKSFNNNGLSLKKLIRLATVLSVNLGLGLYSQAHSQLPSSIEHALSQANISTEDISLVIVPVSYQPNQQDDNTQSASAKRVSLATNASRLSTLIVPNKVAQKSAVINDPDALPPEQSLPAFENLNSNLTTSSKAGPATASNDSSNSASSLPSEVIPPTAQLSKGSDSAAVELKVGDRSVTVMVTDNSAIAFDNAASNNLPFRYLADIPRTPASTMKLIPTFIALDLLGPDFVWFTQVYHTGYISANTLYGDLIIKGSGDPKLTHQRLNKLLYEVNKAGIRHIEGNIILDSSVFQNVSKDPAAFDNDPLRPYNASPDGLLINFSSIEMTAIPLNRGNQQDTVQMLYRPMLADYNLPSTLGVTKTGQCTTLRTTLAPVWQHEGLKFNKPLPISCGMRSFYIAYPDAKEFAKRVVKNKWLNLGNTVSGNVKFLNLGHTLSGDIINTEYPLKTEFGNYLGIQSDHDTSETSNHLLSSLPSSPLPFVRYPSLPLSQQIYDINHYSNNVMTEQLTLTLPLYVDPATLETDNYDNMTAIKTMKSHYSDYNKALSIITHWWQQNLHTSPPAMTNGSGLCRDCTVTADNLAELLQYAYQHPDFETYVNSLGVAGVDGTIAQHSDRLPHSAAIGRAWIKTGTLNNVTSMAGYVHGRSGQDYVVVGIINSENNRQALNTYEARYVLDNVLDWTAKQ